ncbi:PR domain zinc finger protein 13, partial [Tyrophagus putrescentiae]
HCRQHHHHHHHNNTHHLRLVQAAERIEAGTSSKPFHFDMVRLMSILYSQSVSQCSTEKPLGKKPKPLKIQIINGLLHCAHDPSGWTYRVRLAANCFEQNLIAAPLGGIHQDLVTGSLNAFSPISSHHHSRQLRVVLRSTRSIAPGEELAFWPSFDLNLALGIPFLSPSNIINGTCYICTSCGKSYTQPNPLKIHLKF